MKSTFFIYILIFIFFSCTTAKKTAQEQNNIPLKTDTVSAEEAPSLKIYNASEKRINDLLHTKLDVKFDYEKKYLYGKATLTFKPYYYPVNSLDLDAKGFDIAKVLLLEGKEELPKELKYTYDGKILQVELTKMLNRNDTCKVYIEYTAKPDELEAGGSAAITSDKGLYFINPDGKDLHKPVQIWTQGETEASSCWFPTIDAPNEKMTQELFITVKDKYVTLSNGLLVFSIDNGDGTRTDCWKQDLPHAPYLAMMAIGEYAVVKDSWRNIDVNYYVEKEYELHAKAIFGNTPEMLEFYSKSLGVDYPWDKYHQVVVRDYVSGAMENTGAVIFGDFVQKTTRELLDEDYESIIAHELFHHWFGDLVTCESWANLPLNESFATYGEYLWLEHKYGRDEADYHILGQLNQYLIESRRKQADMIRFDYADKEDMFDSHSYAKGGRILHMLRKYVGDEAFFASLKLYLTKHKFGTVEIHDLRLAFEAVTGEDLNWFFNQWFLASGHPEISITTSYSEEDKKVKVRIKQNQSPDRTPLYTLPLAVDIYAGGTKERHKINLVNREEEFSFPANSKPDLVNVDAEKMLLAVKKEQKQPEEWLFQYNHAPLFLDRHEAIDNLGRTASDSLSAMLIKKALNDKHWAIRILAIRHNQKIKKYDEAGLKAQLTNMVQNDPKSAVRAAAITALNSYEGDDITSILKKGLQDSSYTVMGEALKILASKNEKEALLIAKSVENEKNATILTTVARIYIKNGSDEQNDFFLKSLPKLNSGNKYAFINLYAKFLKKCSDETINKSLPVLENEIKNENAWWMRLGILQVITEVYSLYSEKEAQWQETVKNLTPENAQYASAAQQLEKAGMQKNKVAAVLKRIKENENDPTILKFLGAF